jgi:cellulose synthase/poly-beta-1,6-N-acetylglucosamine synthase-like glycosyltransferase
MTDTLDRPTAPSPAPPGSPDPDGDGVWVVLPTYNEAENIEPIVGAILASLPAATVLVVDDGSPDGTGDLADRLAASDPRVRVRHRPQKQGLGRAYLDGFGVALAGGATVIVRRPSRTSPGRSRLVPPTSSSARVTQRVGRSRIGASGVG